MAGDLIRDVRRGVLARLKGDPTVTALVPASQLHPSTTPPNPVWPFARFDAPTSTPISLSCVEGATVSFLYHFFARDRVSGGQVIETAEDHAARIGSAGKVSLHNRRVPVADVTALLRVRSVRLLRDADEESAYHAILTVDARVLAA
jgi:hypothetical protein